ncbi:MAG: sce7725 family protein [Bacteroidales bacterium]|nr:sce7725 family protein [Bacteroidales bacterium]MCF8405237.1 sce7725 family protein [Bacteroidales bacterium]
MYLPYLRGRQFELIALREYAQEKGDSDNLIPIIEPVRKTTSSLKLAVAVFKKTNLRYAVIFNPQVGDLKGRYLPDEYREIINDSNWIPAFVVSNNVNEISDYVEAHDLNHVMLINSRRVDSTSEQYIKFVSKPKIEFIVTEENKSLKRRLKDLEKNLILLNDSFIPKSRNSDYLDAPKELFTEENIFYEEEGYFGFSDYTTISSEFTEGGTTPYAVVIHLTYQKGNEQIWIRHFTSESNDDRANIQGKFAEAAEKAVNFLNHKNIQTVASQELREYFSEAKYPGLGMIKKISIKNHLELINSIL